MKWYRHVHSGLIALSFIPMVMSLWPFHLALLPLLLMTVPFAINEIILDRRSRRGGSADSWSIKDKMLHSYRES